MQRYSYKLLKFSELESQNRDPGSIEEQVNNRVQEMAQQGWEVQKFFVHYPGGRAVYTLLLRQRLEERNQPQPNPNEKGEQVSQKLAISKTAGNGALSINPVELPVFQAAASDIAAQSKEHSGINFPFDSEARGNEQVPPVQNQAYEGDRKTDPLFRTRSVGSAEDSNEVLSIEDEPTVQAASSSFGNGNWTSDQGNEPVFLRDRHTNTSDLLPAELWQTVGEKAVEIQQAIERGFGVEYFRKAMSAFDASLKARVKVENLPAEAIALRALKQSDKKNEQTFKFALCWLSNHGYSNRPLSTFLPDSASGGAYTNAPGPAKTTPLAKPSGKTEFPMDATTLLERLRSTSPFDLPDDFESFKERKR